MVPLLFSSPSMIPYALVLLLPLKSQTAEPVKITPLPAIVSAYTSDPAETDSTPDITASGTSTRNGIIACPRKHPFGRIVWIDGTFYQCEDRMNSRYEGKDKEHFDIWMGDKRSALAWGRRTVQVYFVE